MDTSKEKAVKTPTEARAGERSGIVWKVLGVSVVLAILAMLLIGQGTDTESGNDAPEGGGVKNAVDNTAN